MVPKGEENKLIYVRHQPYFWLCTKNVECILSVALNQPVRLRASVINGEQLIIWMKSFAPTKFSICVAFRMFDGYNKVFLSFVLRTTMPSEYLIVIVTVKGTG